MAIVYILKLQQKNGQIETSTTQFEESEITLGRRENSKIRLDDPSVSLNHARISIKDGRLILEDLGSFSGTKVDHKLISRKVLSDGDTFQIGDLNFAVTKEGDDWQLLEERLPREHLVEDTYIKSLADKLDHKKQLPSITLFSGLFALVVAAFFLVIPFQQDNFESWSSGPISNQHRTLTDDCRACHTMPFERVKDDSCLSCHNMADHSDKMDKLHAKHSELDLSCVSCHVEHSGSKGLIIKDSALCSTCHASLNTLLPESKILEVSSLESHPQFHLTQKDSEGSDTRVSLDDSDKIHDANPLKLNHKIHLEPNLAGPDGATTLTCSSCHKIADNKKNFVPITFEGECQSCHPLTFDGPSEPVSAPHGEPEELYHFLKKYYAALFLDSKGDVHSWEAMREMPGGIIERSEKIEFSKPLIEAQSRLIEDQLVNRTACTTCHKIIEKEELESENESKFDIDKPSIPSPWFTKAIFDHTAHDNISCESCHKGVSESELTSDVLLPDLNNCLTCHHDTGKDSRVTTSCITCHSFHEPLPLATEKKTKIQ